MTYRVIHTPPNTWWPEHVDVATKDEANRIADTTRELGGEVSVHLLPEEGA